MRKLIKYLRENKKKVLTVIGVLAFIIFIIHFANAIIIENYQKQKKQNDVLVKESKEDLPTKSIVSNEKISKEDAENNGSIIKQFIEYCNQKKYQNAFNILGEECKEEVFSNNIELFIENYCKKIFISNTTYNIELWTTENEKYIYRIKYYENNLLATGGTSNNKNIEDYITIIGKGEDKKININGFIFAEEINKTISRNDIEITVKNRKVYKTYEKYNFIVKNNSNNTILLATSSNEKDICLVDNNNVEYSSLIYEVPQHLLNIQSGYQHSVDLRFNKIYNNQRIIEKLRFKNIILDYKQNSKDSEIKKVIIEVKI